MTVLLVLLFFSGYAAHRDLHSFPTRRSSDLARSAAWRRKRKGPIEPASRVASQPPGEGRARSEEHTSELQSLRHLVCRLLLEKKKHNHKRDHIDGEDSPGDVHHRCTSVAEVA